MVEQKNSNMTDSKMSAKDQCHNTSPIPPRWTEDSLQFFRNDSVEVRNHCRPKTPPVPPETHDDSLQSIRTDSVEGYSPKTTLLDLPADLLLQILVDHCEIHTMKLFTLVSRSLNHFVEVNEHRLTNTQRWWDCPKAVYLHGLIRDLSIPWRYACDTCNTMHRRDKYDTPARQTKLRDGNCPLSSTQAGARPQLVQLQQRHVQSAALPRHKDQDQPSNPSPPTSSKQPRWSHLDYAGGIQTRHHQG